MIKTKKKGEIEAFCSVGKFIFELKTLKKKVKISVENISSNLNISEGIIKCRFEIEKFNLLNLSENAKVKHILTSEYLNSFDHRLYGKKNNQEKVVKSISFEITKHSKKIPLIDISFGSLYLMFEPEFISQFLKDILSVVQVNQLKQLSWSEVKKCISMDKVTHYRKNKKNRITNISEKELEFKINFKVDLFSAVFISMNEEYYLPFLQFKIGKLNIEYDQYLKANKSKVNLGKLSLLDLTNFPNTLNYFDIDRIEPKELISGVQVKTWICLEIFVKDGLFYDVPNGDDVVISGSVEGISLNYQQTQTKRIFLYLFEVILPILLIKETLEDVTWATPNYINEVYLRLSLGLWVRLDIFFKNCEVMLSKGEQREELQIKLSEAKLTNRLVRSQDRVIEKGPSGVGIEDLISQDFMIQMKKVSIHIPTWDMPSTLVRPVDLDVSVNMLIGEGDYSLFYYTHPVTHVGNWIGNTKSQTIGNAGDLKKSILKYENSIQVTVNIGSIVLELGNEEYLRIMRTVFKSIIYHDLHDEVFLTNFELKNKLRIEQGILIEIHMDRAGVILMDYDHLAFGKLFIEGVDMGVVIKDDGPIQVKIEMEDLRGSFLEKTEEGFIEKSLVNDSNMKTKKTIEEKFKEEIVFSVEQSKKIRTYVKARKVFQKERAKKKIILNLLEEKVSRTIKATINENTINLNLNFLKKVMQLFLEENEEDLEINRQKYLFKKQKLEYEENLKFKIGKSRGKEDLDLEEFSIQISTNLNDNKFLIWNGQNTTGLLLKGDIKIDLGIIGRVFSRDIEQDLIDNNDLIILYNSLKHKDQFVNSGKMVSKKSWSKRYFSGQHLGLSGLEEIPLRKKINRMEEEEKLEALYAILRNRSKFQLIAKIEDFQIFFEDKAKLNLLEETKKRKIVKPCSLLLEFEQFVYYKKEDEPTMKSTRNIKSLTVSQMNISERISSIRNINSRKHFDFTKKEAQLCEEFVFKGNINKVTVDLSIKDIGKIEAISRFQFENLQKNEKLRKSNLNLFQEEKLITMFHLEVLFREPVMVNLINDYKGVLSKNFSFLINNLGIFGDFTNVVDLVFHFNLECRYFNEKLHKWEPFVENTSLIFELEQTFETKEEQLAQILREKQEKEEGMISGNSSLKAIKEIRSERSILEQKMKDISSIQEFEINESMVYPDEDTGRKRTILRLLQGVSVEEALPSNRESRHTKIMNVNLTFDLLVQIKQFFTNIGEMLDEKKTQKPRIEPPFKITNMSGYPIELDILKEEYLLTRECKLNKKKLFSKNYKVDKNRTFDVFDDFDSFLFKKSNKKMHMSFGTGVSFKLDHPTFPNWKSEQLTFSNQASSHVTVMNKEGLKYQLLYLTRVNANSQEIFIGSTVEIINKIPGFEFENEPITISVNSKIGKFAFDLESGKSVFIPFDHVDGKMGLFFRGRTLLTSDLKFENFRLRNHGHLTPFKDDKSKKNFAIRYERDLDNFFQMKFILLPVFEIVNYLPFYTEVFLSNSILKKVIPLEPGNSFQTSQYTMKSKFLN